MVPISDWLYPVIVWIMPAVVVIISAVGVVSLVVWAPLVVGVGATTVAFVIFPFPLVSFMVKENKFPVVGDVKETAKFGADFFGEQNAVESGRTFSLILNVNLQVNFLDAVLTVAEKLSTWTVLSYKLEIVNGLCAEIFRKNGLARVI